MVLGDGQQFEVGVGDQVVGFGIVTAIQVSPPTVYINPLPRAITATEK